MLRLKPVKPLGVVVALAICAAAQPRFGEQLFVNLPEFPQFHLCFVNINFLAHLSRNLRPEFFLPCHAGQFEATRQFRNKKIVTLP